MSERPKTSSNKPFKIALVTPVADLYHRLWPEIDDSLFTLAQRAAKTLQEQEGLLVACFKPVSTAQQVSELFQDLLALDFDLVLMALAPYCPSGVQLASLRETPLTLLLWPMQEIFDLQPDLYDNDAIKLNHGVHAVQDLAHVLTRHGRAFGVIHGHVGQADFRSDVHAWARAGRIGRVMQQARPLQLGGHFDQMLDLQIGSTAFIQDMGLAPTVVSLDTFVDCLAGIDEGAVQAQIEAYHTVFDIATDVDPTLQSRTARADLALHTLLKQHQSHAFAGNFLTLCNDPRIGDALHVAASRLMAAGYGYAGEGDWVTAVWIRGLQQGFGRASFSEMFTVDYAGHRILLKHWGEGNIAMARMRPRLVRSGFTDRQPAEFAIVDFEFTPGPALLANLNVASTGQGQVISVTGTITEDPLPYVDGPRALFKPDCQDLRELLTNYAYAGGTHHLALIDDARPEVLEKLCTLNGWIYKAY